jgi:hypothetical protein
MIARPGSAVRQHGPGRERARLTVPDPPPVDGQARTYGAAVAC